MNQLTLKRIGIRGGSVFAGLFVAVGLLHTPMGRPLLARLGVGCPVQASPQSTERAREGAVAKLRGATPSPSRPALGFQLDSMSLADVNAWADRNHVSCDESRGGALVKCKDVPSSALGETGPKVDELVLGFVPTTGKLVNVMTTRAGLDATTGVSTMNDVAATLEKQLGPPSINAGTRSAEFLSGNELRTAIFEYRFNDYMADVTTTNLPGRGLLLREHYMSARD